MNDPLNISLSKAKFNMVATPEDGNGSLDLIRWGTFNGADGKPRIAAFKISMIDSQMAHQADKDLVAESDSTTQKKEAQEGDFYQAYEWEGDSFVSVDVKTQTWFKFL